MKDVTWMLLRSFRCDMIRNMPAWIMQPRIAAFCRRKFTLQDWQALTEEQIKWCADVYYGDWKRVRQRLEALQKGSE